MFGRLHKMSSVPFLVGVDCVCGRVRAVLVCLPIRAQLGPINLIFIFLLFKSVGKKYVNTIKKNRKFNDNVISK